MAEKRMLSKKVLDTDAFLDMPLSAQALYFHLVINADDEGFVGNPKRIRDYIGADESDLDLLIEKKFVLMLKSSVAVIRHWKIHNTLRRDRSHPTVFTEEKAQLILQENGAYAERVTSGCVNGNQTATACQPDDNRMATEDKIEETVFLKKLYCRCGLTSIWTGTDFRDVKSATLCAFMFRTIRRSAPVVCANAGASRLKRRKSLKSCAVILMNLMTDKGFPLWVTGTRIAVCQRR